MCNKRISWGAEGIGGDGGYSRVQSEAVAAGVVAPKVVVLHSHAGTVNAVVVAVRELNDGREKEEDEQQLTRSHSRRERASD
jgi:hypothetical protein